MTDQHRFSVNASWDPSAQEGRVANPAGTFEAVHAGAIELGGTGAHVNPEELVAAALGACFTQTWAIFLAKLKVPIERPEVSVACTVEKDPAGGFLITRVEVSPRVPAALFEERKADVEKTLQLAEKYCIVSKAVRGAVSLEVTPAVGS